MTILLGVDPILAGGPTLRGGTVLGSSREGRAIVGHRVGRGPLHISLIAGCHADEPVGPAMLARLVGWLASLPADAPILDRASFWIVPHTNPDGAARNATWAGAVGDLPEHDGYDLATYLGAAVRETPGEDVEFGFPRHPDDSAARPENRAVAAFLAGGAPFALHASFHGMAFAAGPWFLLEAGWADRTATMRERLRRQVRAMGYRVHDVDRGGEKGFTRIDEGFTSRPDSRAMAAHFRALGDEATAARFRPSSMEHVRSLGGDPLTLVSEMPLFLLPREHFQGPNLVRPPAIAELRALAGNPAALATAAQRHAVRAMPIADQMRLQLAFLAEGLAAVGADRVRQG